MKNTKLSTWMKKGIVFALLVVTLITAAVPAQVQAATKNKTVTRTYTPMSADGVFKLLTIYGKDSFKITYNPSTKKVVSCSTSQSSKALGTDMIQKGGIRLVKKTAKAWTYEAKWYLNFTILPKPVQQIGKIFGSKIAALSSLGRIATVTVRYTVNGDGTLKHSLSYKFQVPSKMESAARTVGKWFTSAF